MMSRKHKIQIGRGSGKKPKLALSGISKLWIYKCQLEGCQNFISSIQFASRSRCAGHWDSQMRPYLKELHYRNIIIDESRIT